MTALTSRLQALNNAFTLATTFVSLAVRIGCKGTRNVLDKQRSTDRYDRWISHWMCQKEIVEDGLTSKSRCKFI